jgi:heme A synthase
MLDSVVKVTMAIAVIVLLAALGPWLVIWSLNTLFPSLAIEFGLATWAAVIILGMFFRANVSVKRRD